MPHGITFILVKCGYKTGYMKNIIGLALIILVCGCRHKPATATAMNTAASNVSGYFITKYIPSANTLRVRGRQVVKEEGENVYTMTGSVEGFSSFNMPVTVERFNETLHYLGGDPNDTNSWECIEIYVGKNKIK